MPLDVSNIPLRPSSANAHVPMRGGAGEHGRSVGVGLDPRQPSAPTPAAGSHHLLTKPIVVSAAIDPPSEAQDALQPAEGRAVASEWERPSGRLVSRWQRLREAQRGIGS